MGLIRRHAGGVFLISGYPPCQQARTELRDGVKSGRGQAQAGFVLGIVAIIGSIINMIVAAAIIAS